LLLCGARRQRESWSKVERQDDMLISTLASYLKALGVTASLVVELGEHRVTYDLTAGRGAR
jgi:hypothetical protein